MRTSAGPPLPGAKFCPLELLMGVAAMTWNQQRAQAATLWLHQHWEAGVRLHQEARIKREAGFPPRLAQCPLCKLQLTPHQLGGGEEGDLYFRHLTNGEFDSLQPS